MPKTIIKRIAAQKPRKGATHRQIRKRYGRKRNGGAKTETSRIIANSVFALTPLLKTGLEVSMKMNGQQVADDSDTAKMYKDLFAAYQVGYRLVTGKETNVDPLKSGMSLTTALAYVVNGFRNNVLVPGLELRIDQHDSCYGFTMYRDCPFNSYWHAFEIKEIVYYLKKHNKNLLEVYLLFISYMYHKVNMGTWWNGGLGYAEYQLEELIDEDCFEDQHGSMIPEEQDTEENIKAAEEVCKLYYAMLDDDYSYIAGEVKVYEEYLKQHHEITPEELESQIKSFNKKEPVVAFMINAMEFLKNPVTLSDFDYHQLINDEEWEGISFDRQVTLIWDLDDQITDMEMQSMDAEHSGIGCLPPLLHIPVTKFTKSLDLDTVAKEKWLVDFEHLYKQYNTKVVKHYCAKSLVSKRNN